MMKRSLLWATIDGGSGRIVINIGDLIEMVSLQDFSMASAWCKQPSLTAPTSLVAPMQQPHQPWARHPVFSRI